jgi:hypothetical protein
MRDDEIATALARIEQRQAAYEVVAHRLIGMLEIHNEKLDAILEAATVEPGPSPTTEILSQMLATMQEQTALLRSLPDAISDTIREEMQRELEDEAEWEQSGFDDENEDEGQGEDGKDQP